MLQHLLGSELFLKAQTDERLTALCRAGHTAAFGILVERHRRALLGHACRIVGPGRGEDVLQQALLNAWRALQDGRELRNPQAWLHRIVHNAALTEIERQPHHLEALDTEAVAAESVDSVVEQRDELRQMLHGLAGLPDRERLALLGSELDGRTRRQLADELGLSEGAVRQLVYRARQRMRAGLAVLVPLPFLLRAGRAWARAADAADHLPGPVQAAGGSGLVAGGVKAATVTIVAGAIGGAAVLHVGGGRPPRSSSPVTHAASTAHAHHTSAPTRRATPPVVSVRTVPVRTVPTRSAARTSAHRPAALAAVTGGGSAATTAPRAPTATRPETTTGTTPARTLRSPNPVVVTAPRRPGRATTAEADAVDTGTRSGDPRSTASGGASLDGVAGTNDASPTTTEPTSTTPTTTVPSTTGDATATTDTTSTTSTDTTSATTTAPTDTTTTGDG